MATVELSLPDLHTFKTEFIPEIARSVEPSPASSPSISPISVKKAVNKLEEKKEEEKIQPKIPDLVSHVAFFDRNKDGVILPWETYETLHSDLGINSIVSLGATALLHLVMSYATSESWIPDPFFGINVVNIHRCRLGSHIGVYDHKGRIDMPAFEEKFGKLELKDYFKVSDSDVLPQLTLVDTWKLSTKNDSLLDIVGWVIDKVMWSLLAILENNSISKQSLLDCYKGELYFEEKKKLYSTSEQ